MFNNLDVDECDPSQCANGTCLEIMNSFEGKYWHCECNSGWSGEQCDESNFTFKFFFLLQLEEKVFNKYTGAKLSKLTWEIQSNEFLQKFCIKKKDFWKTN